MIQQWFNGKIIWVWIALGIVLGTLWYSNYLAKQIAADEKLAVEIWVQAQQSIVNATSNADINLAARIASSNTKIPIIETDEKDSLTNNYVNLDTALVARNKNYLAEQLQEFKNYAPPIVIPIAGKPGAYNRYYYGESKLLTQIRFFPIIQLGVVFLFIIVLVIALRTGYISTQNQIWAGLAKETAHQLGTPVSSLQGWIEMLKEMPENARIAADMEKDVQRLLLITDRFGKIGSKPKLEEKNIIEQIQLMMDYVKRRASEKVTFDLDANNETYLPALISPPLFDWVIENLLKNALDAMEGKGKIHIKVTDAASQIVIDVTDTGKGIDKANMNKVFQAGFTTKKRGWGLGLTLTKRIVEQYHKGHIYIVQSELGVGTTFRIILQKSSV